jgi:hypothetical protein
LLRTTPVEADTAAEVQEDIRQSEPGLRLAAHGGAELRCGNRLLVYLWSEEFLRLDALSTLTDTKALLGVVAEKYTTETERWAVNYYVLSQPPLHGDVVRLLAVTTSGTIILAGEAKFEGQRFVFMLHSVRSPGAVPLHFEGAYEGGQLRFRRALAERRRLRKLTPAPSRTPPPAG